ncbi:MAG: divalent metal cation transporter [Myxococcales bacterium]|nr:divalent metal cation transporter [Myxococcales bacterium]
MAHDDLRTGLRIANPPDPEALTREKARLGAVAGQGWLAQGRAYWGLLGPGFLQSAMTLGGGTATAAIFAGAVFGYALLWVAPVAMLLGVSVLAAVSHQTLSTGMRPFEAMRRYAGAPIAWSWATGALLASIIWHFSHYALASALVVDVGSILGFRLSPIAAGVAVLAWAVSLSLLYGRSEAWLRTYERLLKYMVWFVILCFGFVVSQTGISDWGALGRGFLAFEIPQGRAGIIGATVVLSGLSAAVGVNQLFLYPYTLLARGWGREHRRLAHVDLLVGTFGPYLLATSLIVIATANTIHLDPAYDGTRLSPVEAAQSLAGVIGPAFGRVVFDLGVLGMVLSSMTLHMLACGFVCSEVFGWEFGGRRYQLATLLPLPGILGCVYWSEIAVWVAVPTNIVCGLFLPLVYFGIVRLQRSRGYLGDDRPQGLLGGVWLLGMAAGTLLLTTFFVWYLLTNGPAYFSGLFG